ncbi:MAG: hypothetical protein ABSG34_20820 [Candidatus Sulfotelmatobacter sp.]|jgi:hypothetical protein
MERWAANTLRTLGIILTAGFVLVVGLFLALLSLCAAQGGFAGGRHPDQAAGYAVGAVLVLIVGIAVISTLARGIFRSAETAAPASSTVSIPSLSAETGPQRSFPLHLSPLSRKAIDRLVFALGAQILVSAACWIYGQLHFWTAPRTFQPHNWTLTLLAPFILYHIPYALLIYALLKRPGRIAFSYSIAVPAVLVLQSLFSLTVVSYYYVHHPAGFALFVIPWALHIVILVLAYQAIQQVGLHPEPSSLIIAAVVAFFFFSVIHIATPFLYRLTLR